jgi:hypothetical protein
MTEQQFQAGTHSRATLSLYQTQHLYPRRSEVAGLRPARDQRLPANDQAEFEAVAVDWYDSQIP